MNKWKNAMYLLNSLEMMCLRLARPVADCRVCTRVCGLATPLHCWRGCSPSLSKEMVSSILLNPSPTTFLSSRFCSSRNTCWFLHFMHSSVVVVWNFVRGGSYHTVLEIGLEQKYLFIQNDVEIIFSLDLEMLFKHFHFWLSK